MYTFEISTKIKQNDEEQYLTGLSLETPTDEYIPIMNMILVIESGENNVVEIGVKQKIEKVFYDIKDLRNYRCDTGKVQVSAKIEDPIGLMLNIEYTLSERAKGFLSRILKDIEEIREAYREYPNIKGFVSDNISALCSK